MSDVLSTELVALQHAVAGRYSLECELGRGGMAVVYLARDVALDRAVAIKLLPPDLAADAASRERFLREARTAAGLSHPNIVPIHLVEASQDLVFFVMGFVEGETLGERVRRSGPLPPPEAVRVIREVAWALAYAHGRGVIHRDIKPDNILLEKGSGRALVTDFGIARVVTRSTVSQEGEILGTLQFMSPEQADASATLDGRSDLYSLGATAFFTLTGRLPFEATSPVALLAMHVAEPAPPLATVRQGTPPKLAEAVDRCLAKDPAARFPSAESLAEALGEAMPAVRSIPPSVLALRDAFSGGALYVGMTALGYGVARMGWPESATPVGVVAALLLLFAGLNVFIAARMAVLAGFTPRDAAETLRSLVTASDAATEFNRRQARSVARFLARPVGRVLAAAGAVLYGGMGISTLVTILRGWLLDLVHIDWVMPILGGAVMLLLGGVLLVVALRPGLITRPDRPGDPHDWRTAWRMRLSDLLWSNPLMRLLFRVAGLGVRKPKAAPLFEHAATEVLLGKAADDLFAALPAQERKRLAEVPAVIRRLERAAQSLRTRRNEIGMAIGEAGNAASARGAGLVKELEAARVQAGERLAAAVTALENLRLDLLRLRAGVGSSNDLTGSLDEARRVGEQIDAEIATRALLEAPAD